MQLHITITVYFKTNSQTHGHTTMPKQDHIGDLWAENTLNRAVTVGQHVYERAVARRVEWPEMKPASSCNSLVESPSYTSVDDAFSSILHFMSQTSKECKRYYTTNQGKLNTSDCTHCNRFHTAQYNKVQRKDPTIAEISSNQKMCMSLSDQEPTQSQQEAGIKALYENMWSTLNLDNPLA